MRQRTILGLATLVAVLALAVAPAAAKGKKASNARGPKAAVTKMTFKLDQHELEVGDDATGSVLVRTRSGNRWVPLSEVTLEVFLDGESVGTVETDADGRTQVVVPGGDPGEHVVKVRYAGDADHRKAQRAQGFEVAEPDPGEEPELDGSEG